MPTRLATHTRDLADLLTPPPPNASEVVLLTFIGLATLLPVLDLSPLQPPSLEARILVAVMCMGTLVSLLGLALATPPARRTRETAMHVVQIGLGIAAAGSAAYGTLTFARASVPLATTLLCAVLTAGFLYRIRQLQRSIAHHRRLARAFAAIQDDTHRLLDAYAATGPAPPISPPPAPHTAPPRRTLSP